MTDSSRKYIMTRRGVGGNDLSKISTTSGGLSYAEAQENGVWTINSTQQIGIATATEAGLSVDRYPIKVMISKPPATSQEIRVSTAVSYWKLCTLDMKDVAFSRRPLVDTTPIENLYRIFPNIDDMMWEANRYPSLSIRSTKASPELTVLSDAAYGLLLLQSHNDQTMNALRAKIDELVKKSIAISHFPYLKVGPENVILFKPHGYIPEAQGTLESAKIPTAELYLNMQVNFANLRKRYTAEHMAEGTVATAASAIAAMFRYGLYEAYESQEFFTVYVQPLDGQAGKFTVVGSTGPKGTAGPAEPALGTVLDINTFQISSQLLEVGPGLCLASGLNHYMLNHTTGGMVASGALLSMLVMFGMMSSSNQRAEAELVTSLFYEALHPVNKRGIANLFFKRSRVTTHGRATNCMRYEEFKTDQFMKIRLQPQPAGAHKAYVCAAGLRRIIAGGLSMFLDWHAQINDVIEMCKQVLQGGADAHLGSHYYTGRIGVSQSSTIDAYLPEIACYMVNLARNDTLAMSAHLSQEVAARASLSWQGLMKDLKGEDYTTTDPNVVRKFLQSQGKVFHTFDITKEETWGEAADVGKNALAALDAAMG